MTIASISTATNTQGNAQTATSQLSENYDTFLTLLTTQLKNQDPLKPMDTNEFTSQLVQFSSVEQSIQTNKNLENLILMQKAAVTSDATGYIGREVSAISDTNNLTNGSATWNYALESTAAKTTLNITNSKGVLVYSADGDTAQGSHSFVWDGKDKNGNQLADGTYTMSVTAVDADNKTITPAVGIAGTVSGVTLSDDEPYLAVNGILLPLSNILTVKSPAATNTTTADTTTTDTTTTEN